MEAKRSRSEEVEALYALARALLLLDDYDAMLNVVMECALQLLKADRGFLVLKQDGALHFKIVRNWKRAELEKGEESISSTILAEILRNSKPIFIEDALEDERFGKQKSVSKLQIRSVLAAPLQVNEAVVGALYLESRTMRNLFQEGDFALFCELLELSSRALETCVKRILLEQRNALLERDLLARYRFPGMITQDVKFLRILETVARVAATDLPVLVQGPSGTGKELVARSLHLNSNRSRGPFVIINCGAISPSLLESELFGHTRGAFTGAVSDKVGLIASANQGTLFLDEVGELPKELQVKLLRLLQFGEIQPVGASQVKKVDVRFIAATNRDLRAEVQKERFREDLLYRLNAATIQLPALKERPGDILPLFNHFLKAAAGKEKGHVPRVTPRVERVLTQYSWPGNVRELENEAQRLFALTPPGEPLTVERLSPHIAEKVVEEFSAPISLVEREKELIELHLRAAGGNRTHAAKSLGITREGLRQKMKRYQMS